MANEPDEERQEHAEDARLDDWDRRELCSDGSCIGVVVDGRCNECGAPGGSPGPDSRAASAAGGTPASVPDEDRAEDDDDEDDDAVQAAWPDDDGTLPADEADPSARGELDDSWDDRVLCPDGSCIGVLGPDGRCRACGREREVTPAS